MRTTFRQGITSHQTGGFLQLTGSVVNLLASSRPVTVTIAHKDTNYTHSEDNSISNAWFGPFTETNYWLYWDFNLLTFARTFGYTTIEPVAQSVKPGTGNSAITDVVPGDAGVGAFVVDEYYNLPIGKVFAIINSSGNNGNYTVKSISYSTSTGKTTIYVDEAVVSSIVDGEATLDIDSSGTPLYTNGRHWFDTKTNIHYVLQGNVWQPVLRVFAARVLNGNTLISVSQGSQSGIFTGTQIGNNNETFSGRILFDDSSNPIRKSNGTFFTSEDQFFTNQSRVDALRLESNVVRAQCDTSSMSAFSVVAWTGDGKIDVAQYTDVGSTVVGLLTQDLLYTEVGGIIVQGTVTNPSWDWTGGGTPTAVGSALWVNNGELVTVDPHVSDPVTYPIGQVPVARVLDKDTIIFEQGLGGKGDRGPSGGLATVAPADTTNLGGVTLVTPSSDPDRAFVISDTDSRLTNARTPTTHTHPATDVTVQPGSGVTSTNTQAAILELGAGKVDLAGDTMTGTLTLNADPTSALEAATKQYVDSLSGDTYIAGTNITIGGSPTNTISVKDTGSGGTVDALTLEGNNLTTLDLRWAALSHSQAASTITVTPYVGDGNWGSPVDPLDGQITSTVASTAINELADAKAAKKPLYASAVNLPSATTEKGMIVTVDDANTVYFADDAGWTALSRADHTHPIPYDIAFCINGTLPASSVVNTFVSTRAVFIPAGAPNSAAVAGVPATVSPTNLFIHKDGSPYGPPYGSPSEIGTITFSATAHTGTITWVSDVSLVGGDRIVLTTDGSPSDVDEIAITIAGCTPSDSCVLS